MASTIFTYDHNPPKVSSPWPMLKSGETYSVELNISELHYGRPAARMEDYGITKLQPEPQEGPVEYKLHLLLRSRNKMIEPKHNRSPPRAIESPLPARNSTRGQIMTDSPDPVNAAQSSQPRQERVLHLTTQLLWRLQQSSPLHAAAQVPSSTSVPATSLRNSAMPSWPGTIAPGLEQSQGALYEIGVSDNGTLEGLVETEMRESLLTLQSMAASLGCCVVIRRLVTVNDTKVQSELSDAEGSEDEIDSEQAPWLWVVEAFIAPGAVSAPIERLPSTLEVAQKSGQLLSEHHAISLDTSLRMVALEQLRVSLIGISTSGKSSLLGTLSTSTLDNGRGKSRLRYESHLFQLNFAYILRPSS